MFIKMYDHKKKYRVKYCLRVTPSITTNNNNKLIGKDVEIGVSRTDRPDFTVSKEERVKSWNGDTGMKPRTGEVQKEDTSTKRRL